MVTIVLFQVDFKIVDFFDKIRFRQPVEFEAIQCDGPRNLSVTLIFQFRIVVSAGLTFTMENITFEKLQLSFNFRIITAMWTA